MKNEKILGIKNMYGKKGKGWECGCFSACDYYAVFFHKIDLNQTGLRISLPWLFLTCFSACDYYAVTSRHRRRHCVQTGLGPAQRLLHGLRARQQLHGHRHQGGAGYGDRHIMKYLHIRFREIATLLTVPSCKILSRLLIVQPHESPADAPTPHWNKYHQKLIIRSRYHFHFSQWKLNMIKKMQSIPSKFSKVMRTPSRTSLASRSSNCPVWRNCPKIPRRSDSERVPR